MTLEPTTKIRLLIVEDHPSIVSNIVDYLEADAFSIDHAADGREGLRMGRDGVYDVIILDLMLPGTDGIEVCRRLRREHAVLTPILMLTARDTLPDKLEGFDAGTDDYMTKPFSLEELEVRIRALARRGQAVGETINAGDITLNVRRREVLRRGRNLELSPTGFRILYELLRAYPSVVPRVELEAALWGREPPGSDTLRTHVAMLRRELEKPFGSRVIENVYGVGYRLVFEAA